VSTHAELRPLSARSVALSMLLGAREQSMSADQLTGLGELFGISTPTMRVALSRMVGSGDLAVTHEGYSLSQRHLERQAVTESLIHPRRRRYDGRWRMVIVVERGRSLGRRTALRTGLRQKRFGELREGVWLRPDNLDELLLDPAELEAARTFTTLPDGDRSLCVELWDLDGWAATAHQLLDALHSSDDPMQRLAAAAAAVRHLCTDPALPAELEPEQWPADELRRGYEGYRAELGTSLTGRATTPDPVTIAHPPSAAVTGRSAAAPPAPIAPALRPAPTPSAPTPGAPPHGRRRSRNDHP
jgi:phenylacetic acid degradation operon negative regulatory protein